MDLLQRFLDHFRQFDHIPPPFLLAVSGGVDSVVLLNLFHEAGIQFGVAHCNFQLRGSASDGDEQFVSEMAAQMGVRFHSVQFDTGEKASEEGISVQMAARELRYEWLGEIAGVFGYRAVATGHHLNDQVETVLLHFTRGTGLAGMRGIRYERDIDQQGCKLIRPLLFASKSELIDYAEQRKLFWREDASNTKDEYSRNYIRLHVVPRLETLNSNFLQTAARNIARMREAQENLDFLTRSFLNIPDEIKAFSVPVEKLESLPSPLQSLSSVLRPYGFNEEQARQTSENLTQTGFELFSETGWRLMVNRGVLQCQSGSSGDDKPSPVRIGPDDLMVRIEPEGKLFFMSVTAAPPFPDGKEAIVVEPGALKYPLVLRHWQSGDRFQPFGMGGRFQKLQDYFTDKKISRSDKERIRILENGDGAIIWILGYRMDERFRVTGEEAIKISWINT
ncbi:MAG: hypothetical protein RLZ62_1768 [Bacteroidota bacterium]|jgi:tRNA(Ile)-lysidine synthase